MGMPVIPPSTITREEAVGDLIESIAMEESALAHILNAESEKLMVVINSADASAHDLIVINASVQSTVSAISRLEMLLQAKLSLLRATICQ